MSLANQMSLAINGVPITQVITTKFLGVYVWVNFSRLKILNIEQIKTFQVGEFMYKYHQAYYLRLLRASLNLVPKYIPTLPEMPEPINLLSTALTLAYSLLNMLVL